MSRGLAKRSHGLLRVAQEILKPGQFRQRFAIYEQTDPRRGVVMLFSFDYVLPISRSKPPGRIRLRKGKLVGQLNFLEREVPAELVITDPAGVRVQPNPGTREGCERPACLPNSP